jgi:hypothetical protein
MMRIRGPDFMLRFVHARVVKRSGCDALAEISFSAEKSRTAFWTKAADIMAGSELQRRTGAKTAPISLVVL